MRSALALALLILASPIASADAGLDLVLVVDCSKSMQRDPRIGSQFLHLGVDLLVRNAEAYRVRHRLAVVTFASAATTDIQWTPAGKATASALHRQIDAILTTQRDDTDILDAFQAVDALFRTLLVDRDRRRAVVLLTDGVPYVQGTDMSEYGDLLEKFVATQFAGSGISVDVLLLAARRPSDQSLWRRIPGDIHRTTHRQEDILADGHRVIARLIGTQIAESQPSKIDADVDVLLVPPYLDVIVFDVFRGTTNARVEIYPPGSKNPILDGRNGVETTGIGDVLSTRIVPRPPPGQWTIRKNEPNARVRILSQQFFPRGLLLRPAVTEQPGASDRVTIAYRLVDHGNRPLTELGDYRLSLELTLLAPDGQKMAVAIEKDAALGPATYRAQEAVLCVLPGRYWTDVRVTTTDLGGRRLDVFRDRWSGFLVGPRVLHAPAAAEPSRGLLQVLPATIAIATMAIVIALVALRRRRKPTL